MRADAAFARDSEHLKAFPVQGASRSGGPKAQIDLLCQAMQADAAICDGLLEPEG